MAEAGAGPVSALRAALAHELGRMAGEDARLTAWAQQLPAASYRYRFLMAARARHALSLQRMVERHGWMTRTLVGEAASIDALKILLHADDHRDDAFLDLCRELIAAAVETGDCPPAHGAYIADRCAVLRGAPQRFGTRIDPRTLRPFPIEDEGEVDARRQEAGLPPLAGELARHRAARLAAL